MIEKQKRLNFLWLGIYALLTIFISGRWSIPAAAWFAPVFAIRFYRKSKKGGRAFLWVWLATAISTVISASGTTSMHFLGVLIEPVFLTVMSLPLLIPLIIDRIFYLRSMRDNRNPFLLSLVYPVCLTAIDYLAASGPFGSFGSLAYSQSGFTTLMQVASITGLWGISFLISWFGSVVNYFWEGDFLWSNIKKGIAIFLMSVILVFSYGVYRLNLDITESKTVQVGGFSLPINGAGAMIEMWEDAENEEYREAFKSMNLLQLEQVRIMARNGAKIVVLQEVAAQGMEEEIAFMMKEAAFLAQEEGIYLVLPTATIVPNGKDHNVVYIIAPNGEIILEHYKYGGAFIEGSVEGSSELQTVDTPYGRLSAVICWDVDFPDLIRQAGENDVDLLFIPANDWFEIKDLHAGMSIFRSIENGMSIFRQTGNGISLAADPFGRVISHVDMYDDREASWGGKQMVNVPVDSVSTLYTKTGDLFALLTMAGFAGLLLYLMVKRIKRKRKKRKLKSINVNIEEE